jgi:AraC family transcriptional regulator
MKAPTVNSHSQHSSDITLVDVTKGIPFPCAPPGSVLLSSVPFGWRGIIVERHRLEPQELPQHYVVGHGISVSTSKRPIPFGWRGRRGWREGVLNPADFHLLTDGDLNTPRWLQTFDEVSLVLDPRFVAKVVRDGLPADRVEFATRRSASDPTIARYTETFLSELVAESPNGSLYAETLTVGFTLHLLSNYAVAKPKIPLPRGKLNSFQLRTVVDFVQSHLDEDMSLVALSEQAHVSPFHFARQFRATVGVAPHQFVLRQRIQKSLRLIKAGRLPLAQIAVESGFHDQPHFTRAFRKVVGTTPAAYSVRR